MSSILEKVRGVTNAYRQNGNAELVDNLKGHNVKDVISVCVANDLIDKMYTNITCHASNIKTIDKAEQNEILKKVENVDEFLLMITLQRMHEEANVFKATVLNSFEHAYESGSTIVLSQEVVPKHVVRMHSSKPVGVKSVQKVVAGKSVWYGQHPCGEGAVVKADITHPDNTKQVVLSDDVGIINVSHRAGEKPEAVNHIAYKLAVFFANFFKVRKGALSKENTAYVTAMMGQSLSEFAISIIKVLLEDLTIDALAGTQFVNHVYAKLCAISDELPQMAYNVYTSCFLPTQIHAGAGKPAFPDAIKLKVTGNGKGALISEMPPLEIPNEIMIGKSPVRFYKVLDEGVSDADAVRILYIAMGAHRATRGEDKNRSSAVTRCYRIASMMNDDQRKYCEAAIVAQQVSKVWDGVIYLKNVSMDQIEAFLTNCPNKILVSVKAAIKTSNFNRPFECVVETHVHHAHVEPYVLVSMQHGLSFTPSITNGLKFVEEQTNAKLILQRLMSDLGAGDENRKGYYMPVPLISLTQPLYNMFFAHRLETCLLGGELKNMLPKIKFDAYYKNYMVINVIRNCAIYGYSYVGKYGTAAVKDYLLPYVFDPIVMQKPGKRSVGTFSKLGVGGELMAEVSANLDFGFEEDEIAHEIASIDAHAATVEDEKNEADGAIVDEVIDFNFMTGSDGEDDKA